MEMDYNLYDFATILQLKELKLAMDYLLKWFSSKYRNEINECNAFLGSVKLEQILK